MINLRAAVAKTRVPGVPFRRNLVPMGFQRSRSGTPRRFGRCTSSTLPKANNGLRCNDTVHLVDQVHPLSKRLAAHAEDLKSVRVVRGAAESLVFG